MRNHELDSTAQSTNDSNVQLAPESSAPPGQAINIDVEHMSDGVVLARVSGEVDILAAPTLRECIDEHLEGAHALVLDLDGVGFLGSSGLSVLVETGTQVAKTDVKWAIVASKRTVTRPLQATGLDDALPLYQSVADAVSAVTA